MITKKPEVSRFLKGSAWAACHRGDECGSGHAQGVEKTYAVATDDVKAGLEWFSPWKKSRNSARIPAIFLVTLFLGALESAPPFPVASLPAPSAPCRPVIPTTAPAGTEGQHGHGHNDDTHHKQEQEHGQRHNHRQDDQRGQGIRAPHAPSPRRATPPGHPFPVALAPPQRAPSPS